MISYAIEEQLDIEEFITVLKKSTLGERRPIDDKARIQKMLDNASLIIVARDNGRIVGVSRAITDFSFCCYVSDLAVDEAYQRQGIGKKLLEETRKAAGPDAACLLLSAPKAIQYYPHIGMQHLDNAFMFPRTK